MDTQVTAMHRHTPKLIAIDPRGLALRSVDYYRADSGDMAEARVDYSTHDPAGRAVVQCDSRLFQDASAPANLVTIHGLSGTALCTLSVDAGLRVSLFGEAGQPVQTWDGRGSQRWMHYDNQLRLTALFEQMVEGEAICAERLTYAANDPVSTDHNQCGQLISHADLAGVLQFNDYGLTGTLLEQERRLADIAQSFSTHSRFNPAGDLLSRTDAQGNEQCFSQTVDGQLRAVDLRLNHTTQRLPMVGAITYNAHGQVEREVAGNGVITTLEYAAEDGRLQRLLSRLGQNEPLQDLRYSYDPVGNVLSIEDAALPIRYFANQRIEPVSDFWYDTLYRLIAATGWEAGSVRQGPSSAMTADPAMPGNYRQTYRYDAGHNLLELTHTGPQNPGHRLIADAHSNRCLPVREGIEPTEQDFRDSFDANGNLLKLQPGQTLRWDARNQLCEVRPVARDAENDSEHYVYAADGLRVRKVRSLQTNAQTNIIETLYLPGLEIRTHSGTGEVLHVIDVATGRGSVRVLHWEAGRPSEISNDQQRYSLTDHLGSSTLELDQHARLITQERFYPFGGTAWWNGATVQVSYKTVRYSGKEQDATGLYYYGFRYYVPWLQRWINPDPAGDIDGPNRFRFVHNNPVTLCDPTGMKPPTDEEMQANGEAAYNRMFSQGKKWIELRGAGESGLDAMQRLSKNNIEAILNELDIYEISQSKLASTIASLPSSDYTLVHFSESDFRDVDGSVEFHSLIKLQDAKKKVPASHTLSSEIRDFATNDFTFFSLETGAPQKTKSRFGNFRYRVSFEELRGLSHVQFSDVETPNYRAISFGGLAVLPWYKDLPGKRQYNQLNAEDKAVFSDFKIRSGFRVLEAKDLLFFGDDMLSGIGLRVAADVLSLSSTTREAIETQIASQPVETIGSLIYAMGRPQVLTAGMAAFKAPKLEHLQ
ncbi:RHS repeat-associated core domain-containing protein [Pseudomonas migulae]|uniref:RHS repeat-associated core domain-containing protein n=1 Tax=Pseudomonas migulae TaxID=78543 RepID=A0ABY8MVT6_9PSED|nr:RHS repeat-associated core domain-containing protein [Pseudomonas migulae]WGK91478.1 RHS repeat-associated core domain-containing protein [Pseudomonas migulae]